MEIGRHNRVELAKLLLGVQEVDRSHGSQPALKSSEQQDRVHISEHAKELQRIKGMADQPDAVREARVDEIRRSVDSGTYTVDGKKVADALMRQVLLDSVL